MLNWIVWNRTVFEVENVYLCQTDGLEIELFWYLTKLFLNSNYTYIKLNGLKFNSALDDLKNVETP